MGGMEDTEPAFSCMGKCRAQGLKLEAQ